MAANPRMNIYLGQNNGILNLDGGHLAPPVLYARVGSSAAFWVRPPFPTSRLVMDIGSVATAGAYTRIEATCNPAEGMWRVYADGSEFDERGETYYRVVVSDDEGNDHLVCRGVLRVGEGLTANDNLE